MRGFIPSSFHYHLRRCTSAIGFASTACACLLFGGLAVAEESQTDRPSRPVVTFAQIDGNDDGQISSVEWQAFREAARAARQQRMQEDGVTPGERAGRGGREGRGAGGRGRGDGSRLFDRADRDEDGFLSQSEFRRLQKQMARMRQRWQQDDTGAD